jgi:NAD(P)-dependent dehydrogenase (short-subunit alcohol dehydrogenase family)
LEFTRCYLERNERVFAGCRHPEAAKQLQELKEIYSQRLTIVALDIASADSIRASQAVVRSEVDGIELLINNAGIYSTRGSGEPTERLGNLNFEDALTLFRINAIAPLILTQQYIDLLRASSQAKIVSISTGYASLSANTSGFPYYYSASKAAMNMFMRSLAADIKGFGIITVLIDPGWVSTDMGGPKAPLTPKHSVEGMIRVIEALTSRHNGRFLSWQGNELTW